MQQSRDIFFDSNTLIGIYAVTYGVNYTEQHSRATAARAAGTSGYRARAPLASRAFVPKCKSPYWNKSRKLKK